MPNMNNVLNHNATLEDILSNLESVLYFYLNNRNGDIIYFIDTNDNQVLMAEISFCEYMGFELVTSLENFGTFFSSDLFHV